MPETDKMTKLSPAEPLFIIRILIETKQDYPLTKIEKLLRKEYRAKTQIISPYTLEAKFVIKHREEKIYELFNKIMKLWGSLQDKILSFCIEPYILVKRTTPPPKILEKTIKKNKINEREVILVKSNNVLMYVYYNIHKKTISIRPLKNILITTIDPLQLPKSSYIYCNNEINNALNTMKNFITESNKLLNQ